MRLLPAVLITAAGCLAAAEPVSPPIALVDGQPLTLRQLEDALLAKEGTEEITRWVSERLAQTDWTRLKDDDAIMQVSGVLLTRRDLARALLKRDAGKVREELINIAIVERALAKAGITVDAAAIETAWQRTAAKIKTDLAQKGMGDVDPEQWLRAKENQGKAEFTAQPGFRMIAGLHILAERQARAEITETELRSYFDAHRDRYDIAEARRLTVITLPYQPTPGKDGKPVVTPEEQARQLGVARMVQDTIARKQVDFALAWRAWGQANDPTATDGAQGWVLRNGRRDGGGRGRVLPKEVVDVAWEQGALPVLLPPIAHPTGVDIVRVDDRRGATPADFTAMRERVFQDVLVQQLDARIQGIAGRLRNGVTIDYRSLPEAIKAR